MWMYAVRPWGEKKRGERSREKGGRERERKRGREGGRGGREGGGRGGGREGGERERERERREERERAKERPLSLLFAPSLSPSPLLSLSSLSLSLSLSRSLRMTACWRCGIPPQDGSLQWWCQTLLIKRSQRLISHLCIWHIHAQSQGSPGGKPVNICPSMSNTSTDYFTHTRVGAMTECIMQ